MDPKYSAVNTPKRNRSAESQTFTSAVNYGSASYPRDYSEAAVLKADMAKAHTACFGGKLFISKDHRGDTLICHAVRTTDRELIDDLSKWYHETKRLSGVRFLPYEHSTPLGNGQVAFLFDLNPDHISMRELMKRPDHQTLCADLFNKLVDFLWNYRREMGGTYQALCCISLDTVFMDQRGRIHLLPLVCDDIHFPKGYPLEAGTDEADESTDLYTAALLSMQVLSGCEYESRSTGKTMRMDLAPDALRDCLCIFPSRRPTLNEVRNMLGGKSHAHNEPSHSRTTTSNDPQPSREGKPGPLGFLRRKLQNTSLRYVFGAPKEEVADTADYPRPPHDAPRPDRDPDDSRDDDDRSSASRRPNEAEYAPHYTPGRGTREGVKVAFEDDD